MRRAIRLGISTCPNDTFAFHGLLNNRIDSLGLDFKIELLDIQQLNSRLSSGMLDFAKASYFAAIKLGAQVIGLPVGSAIGFGVGPLLLSARPGRRPSSTLPGELVLCPGADTTAHLLYQLFYGGQGNIEQVVFSDIMPRLTAGRADYGVCIHEGRFTWEAQGLFLIEDLGDRWERETGCPLPLGGIFAQAYLDPDEIVRVARAIRNSLSYGLANRAETLVTMRRFAQELSDDVIWKHVDLYVNELTLDLGKSGRKAVHELVSRAAAAGLVNRELTGFTVYSFDDPMEQTKKKA